VTGSELRRIRTRLGLTQTGFADLLGVAGNTVARWERDERRMLPAMDRYIRLVAAERSVRPSRRRR
jgi:DNA-binding transcriptional regulator YiaG